MRYLFLFFIAFSFLSCDDGDFDVLQFNFETTVNSCGTYVLYRTNSEKTEALIIHLTPTDIVQEVGVKEIQISATNVFYRIFDEALGSDYFCNPIPPTSPTVLKEWTAIAGIHNKILIDTTEIIDETDNTITGYKHTITFSNLVLENNGVQEKYISYEFGSVTSVLPIK